MARSLDHGGCERDAAKIAVGLDRSRFEPHVAVFHAGGFRTQEVEAAGVPILDLAVRSFSNSTALRGAQLMGAYVRQHGIQLIHSFDVPMNIFAAPVARWRRIPIVVTSQLSFRYLNSRKERAALRVSDFLSDRIVVNSCAVAESLQREIGFPKQKIYVCYNGVDPGEFYPEQRVSPPALEGGSLVIGSVCVMRAEKRIDWIMRSFAQVRQIDPDLGLLLVGSGPEIPRLTALRDALGLRDVCHFEAGRRDVADWMRSMDIYINSSSSESFPNALLEAMACGCCVIGSKIGGIPELVTHLEDGLLFDSDKPEQLTDMLRLAVSSLDLRQKLRRQAVATARGRFSMQATLQRTEALYQSLLERRRVKKPALASFR